MQKIFAKPFLKWVGGKTQLLEQFRNYYPIELVNGEIDNYFEPFIGGGAVFFHIIQNYKIKNAFISDLNEELILVYKVIQKDVDRLIEELSEYNHNYKSLEDSEREKYFYKIREDYNIKRNKINHNKYSVDWITRTAQAIFLNKTCYNGLFRLNRKGEFNTPFGNYKNPKILDRSNLKIVSNLLQRVQIEICDFIEIKKLVTDSSFVYYDPPYRPISKTSSFTSYSKYDFSDNDQLRLNALFKELDKVGVKQMLSNSDPKNGNSNDDFFDNLYKGFNICRVSAIRAVNCNGSKRGKINELVITNYKISKVETQEYEQMYLLNVK